jgi:uncharacterized protein YutE (UPF0331/DUF86 family)
VSDIVLAKAEIVERSLARVATVYAAHSATLEQNFDAQDVIVLNLQRACEAAIDLAMHIVRQRGLGLPKDSRDGFTLLERAGLVAPPLAERLRRMVSFRNIAVHDYRALDWAIVRAIVERGSEDLREFARQTVMRIGGPT